MLLTALSIGSLVPALVLAVAGAWLGLRYLRPLLPEGSLRLAPGRPSGAIGMFAISFAFFGTEAFVPLSVVELRGGSVTLGGLALSAAAITWVIGSWLQDRAAGAGIRRTLVVAGGALIAAGIVVTAGVLVPNVPVLIAPVGWAIAGLGMGLAYSMLALLMLETAGPGEEGFSSAALQLMFTLGTAFGAGVGGAVVATSAGEAQGLAQAIGIVFAIMAVVALLSVVVGWRVPRGPSEQAAPSERPILPAPLEHP
jgi:MFS family permease